MKRRGASLLIVLAIIVGLTGVVAVAAESSRSAFQARRNRMEMRRARLAAEAGIQRALQTLSTQAASPVQQTDDWHSLGTTGQDNFLVGSVSFRIQIVDACQFINLNTAPASTLQRLPLTTDQVDSFLDWRSAGQTARSDGAKDDYYHNLTHPYNTKLAGLTTFDELLQVKGFSASVLYNVQDISTTTPLTSTGTPTLDSICTVDSANRALGTSGSALRNINGLPAQALIQAGISNGTAQRIATAPNRPFTSMGTVIRLAQTTTTNPNATRDVTALLNNFQAGAGTTQTGRINLNTAGEASLNSITELPSDSVQQILNQQSTGFSSVANLLSIPGINLTNLPNFVDRFCVNSSRFIVRVVGTAGTSTYTLEAVVDTSGSSPKVLSMRQPPFSDMTTRWQWNDASNDINLGGQ